MTLARQARKTLVKALCPLSAVFLVGGLLLGVPLATAPPASAASAANITTGPLMPIPGGESYLSISCFSAAECEGSGLLLAEGVSMTGEVGIVGAISNGVPAPPLQVAGTTDLSGVACPNATTCVAVGRFVTSSAPNFSEEGVIVPITDGVPGAVQVVAGTSFLSAIACPTTSTCFAVGESTSSSDPDAVVTITGGVAGAMQDASAAWYWSAIACESATTCVAVGPSNNVSGVVTIHNGTLGTPQDVSGIASLDAIGCPTAHICLVAAQDSSSQNFLETIHNGTPRTPVSAPYGAGLGCITAHTCYLTGYNDSNQGAVTTITNGAVRRTHMIAGTAWLSAISCVSGSFCEVQGGASGTDDGVVFTIKAS